MADRWRLSRIIVLALAVLGAAVGSVYAQSAKEHYDLANNYLNTGKYDDALAELNKAIQIDPNTALYYKARGELYRLKSDVESAIPDYTKAIELNPNDGEVHYFRAIAYFFTQEYDKAWDDVHAAQSLGYAVPSAFITDLKNTSGKGK